MTAEDTPWASDVPISMPVPSKNQALIPMFGFVFTEGGLAHNLTPADYDRLSTPDFAPEEPRKNIRWGDQDIAEQGEEVF